MSLTIFRKESNKSLVLVSVSIAQLELELDESLALVGELTENEAILTEILGLIWRKRKSENKTEQGKTQVHVLTT